MTTELTERLRRGRAAAAEQRRKLEDAQHADFRAWLSMEADAYQALRRAREAHGAGAPETWEAYEEWRGVMSLRPTLPPDGAFKRARGDTNEDEEI
ncbi:MAG: hypothetical protein ACXVHB_06030 [Solirubrobacteraceae bacterium]